MDDEIEYGLGDAVGLSVRLSVPGSGSLPDVNRQRDRDEHPLAIEDVEDIATSGGGGLGR